MKREFTLELKETTSNQKDRFVIKIYEQEDISMHNHKFFELVYVMEGKTVHTLNGTGCTLHRGDYFVVDYGSEHAYTHSENLKLMNCLFLPEIIDDTLKGCCSFTELLHVCLLRYYKLYFGKNLANRVFQDENGKVLNLLLGMKEEYEQKKVGYAEVFRGRLQEILIIIMRNITDQNKREVKNDTILNVVEYINRNYPNHTLLLKFCEENHYTTPYISRKFKQEMGITVSEYLQKVRIAKSCELLAGSNILVADVAEAVGYNDIKFFNKLFKRMIKMSPREYRSQ